ncbi:MAG: DUF4403 family protein, partial [Myxococcales bacterium]
GQANRQAAELRRRIDEALPQLDEAADALWRALATTVPVGAGACARVAPRALIQTGPRRRDGVLAVGLGVAGQVSLESPCGRSPAPGARPAPELDREASAGIDLRVPHRLAWSEVSVAAARSLTGADLPAGADVLRATDARAAPGPDGRLRLTLTLAADAVPADGGVRIAHATPAPGEAARAPGLDLDALAGALEGKLRIPLPTDVSTLSRRLDQLAAQVLQPSADGPLRLALTVSTTPSRLERVVAARDGLVAVVATGGQARLVIHPALSAPAGP